MPPLNAGGMLYLHGDSGTMYEYIHLNNDLTMRETTPMPGSASL